jgi:hypothetical protein
MNVSSFTFLLFLLLAPLTLVAQTLPEGAQVNKDRCLGYEMEYKKYPKPIIAKVQADMYQLYHLEADWQQDAARTGKPLNDGILGPVTWSWMQRFCKSFALDTNKDVVAAFPQRATEIATFSELNRDDANTLTSIPFAQWAATHHHPCTLDTPQVLAQGTDAELQELLRCYRQPAPITKPDLEIGPVETPDVVRANTLYVFRADDFATMAGAAANDVAKDEIIKKIPEEDYPDKKTAMAGIGAMLSSLSPEASKKITGTLSKTLVEKTRYEINNKVLNTLRQQGISSALFTELKKLSNKAFGSQKEFNEAINAAIKKSMTGPQIQASAATASSTTTDNVESGMGNGLSSGNESLNNNVASTQPGADMLLVQIQQASEQTYVELDINPEEAIARDSEPLVPVMIKILKTMQDIEYPTENLIRLAIQDKILKASGICKQDKSNTVDNQLTGLEPSEQVLLAKAIDKAWEPDSNSNPQYCDNNHHQKLTAYYRSSWDKVLQQFYLENMPPYDGKNIFWDGSGKNCGCVREEIQTMAYGIYPYWKAKVDEKGKPGQQIFDFSTFSRVAYFGLTVNDDGTLAQINSNGSTPTLLNNKEDDAKQFIREARRYGSKMDWIIEKEFSLAPGLNAEVALKPFFANLKRDLLTLLETKLDDPESHLRPLLSLGLAAQPTNGDGITFYFKNYPEASIDNEAFKNFFTELKAELRTFDERRDRFNAVKNHTYVNIIVSQSEFLAPDSVFSRTNLSMLTINNYNEKGNATNPEIQEQVKSMIVLLLEDPYYNALDTIYAVTDGPIRSIIAPLMFTDYSKLEVREKNSIGAQRLDEREKRLSYIHESFGGGGFWPIVEYENSSDGKNYDGFNQYVGERFSPGYASGSWWNETLCSYRWVLISIMNVWLLLALAYVVSIFYLYPHRCKDLPGYIRWLQHPLTVVILLLPLVLLWVYIFVVYAPLRSINLTNLIGLIVLILVIVAGIDAVKDLKKIKPNRNLLQSQRKMPLPKRMPEANVSGNGEMEDPDNSAEFK